MRCTDCDSKSEVCSVESIVTFMQLKLEQNGKLSRSCSVCCACGDQSGVYESMRDLNGRFLSCDVVDLSFATAEQARFHEHDRKKYEASYDGDLRLRPQATKRIHLKGRESAL
uniref:Uncharacterized protein n=1 Tax=Erythrolobus madagascarensis TaxID=708628 RepID=A0A6T9YN07_9RHOD|mmetsp:Transcript_1259/g.2545  ORF Transcript_1259/g.2545 Transcript_1259/m.2545 type:complete len:113 (+) Transcript_1259:342-680(+)